MADTGIGTTDVKICQAALVYLGLTPIQGLDDGDDKALVCNTVYPMVRDELLVIHPWRFTMTKQQLSQLVAAPNNEWKYAYQQQSDRISGGVQALFTSSAVGAKPLKEFDVYGEHIYANEPELWCDYQANVSESKWPPYFYTLMAMVMAARMAEALTDDSSKGEKWEMKAFGPPSREGRGGFFATARRLDSQLRPPQAFEDFDLISARY